MMFQTRTNAIFLSMTHVKSEAHWDEKATVFLQFARCIFHEISLPTREQAH